MLKLSQVRIVRNKVFVPREALENADEIPEGENYFLVRGLSLIDIGELVKFHFAQLEDLWVKILGDDLENASLKSIDGADLTAVAKELLSETPALVAHIIHLAADGGSINDSDERGDHYDNVAQLPTSVQLIALAEIARLTFFSEEQLGKVWKVFVEGNKSVRTVLNLLGKRYLSGSGIVDSGKA